MDISLTVQQKLNNTNSPLDVHLVLSPAAGVFGDEHQFFDGAFGLKMFPPANEDNGDVLGTGKGADGEGLHLESLCGWTEWLCYEGRARSSGCRIVVPNSPQGHNVSSMSCSAAESGTTSHSEYVVSCILPYLTISFILRSIGGLVGLC
jgi:hypothetical protein